ncbi:MAG: hypothetical protein KIT34_12440 [Cyanobacteria bacterium TGS_CYA1]|nr:hypothetical protein [Cyanobacteria bacterium TGS_CYA1]MDX2106087.1 hypothetical protein [Candidatus Melainabacteria bacterium]
MIEPELDMNQITSSFQELLNTWAHGGALPEQAIEVSHPHFCEKLGVDPQQFSFQTYAQVGDPNEWNQSGVEFPEVLEGTMYMYIPSRWKMELKQSNLAQVLEGEKVRMTMILTSREEWRMTLSEFFKVGEVSAYAYYPVQLPHYDKWIACIDRDKRMWIYTFYRAGDWILITKGDAGGRNTLVLHVSTAVHSSPWYSWMSVEQAT